MIDKPTIKQYKVNHIKSNSLLISGKGDSVFWVKANILNDFCSPWDKKKPTSFEFKALYDNLNLFFLFKVFDRKIHIDNSEKKYDSINNSDRLELFFKTDNNLNPYYCLEIDPTSRLMDFKALPKRNFDFNWSWPKKEISIKSNINKDYFTIEGSISLKSLKELKLLNNVKLEVGVYRAKYFSNSKNKFDPVWVTWVNPNTIVPDFHIASSFGEFILD